MSHLVKGTAFVISDIHEVVTKHDNEWLTNVFGYSLKNCISKTTRMVYDKVEVG